MEKLAWDFAKQFTQCLVGKAWEELEYLRGYKSYVERFENEQQRLLAKVKNVELKINDAKKRNETQVDPVVEDWLERAKKMVQHDSEPTKCFGLCKNCFSQIVQAKALETLTKEYIPKLIAEVDNFDAYAHAAGAPSIEFHSQEFVFFESRQANFEELKKGLEDENKHIIGLQGMGGTGKSTMAIEVGKHVEKSNHFDRVIFITVSTPIEEKRIREDIAKALELQLEEEMLLTHAQQIWNRISSVGKLLIILDDVWEKLNLKNIGIQPHSSSKGRCCVLLTTRYENVCTQMSCQERIKLETLPKEDALKLFLFHATEASHCFPNNLKNVAEDIVNECGRSPVIVVAMAKTLKDWPTEDWQHALTTLESTDEPLKPEIVDEDEDVMKFYNSLKLSYTHLKDMKTQELLMLCSIFPKAHEIPVEILSRIAIGLGLFSRSNTYDIARSEVRVKKNKLINSSLLLRANEDCVKLHDVIRKLALEIGNEEIQVIMDSKTKSKENLKYSSWIIDGFPDFFYGSKLKVLLVWLNANGSLDIPDALFGEMKSLRVLLLHSKIEYGRTSALSLPESIQSLKEIRTLSLKNWELDDISVLLRNLQKLESLELTNCSIIELSDEISGLNKLRFLCLKCCSIERNNPFEVISRCSQLEELYYVSNDDQIPIGPKVPQITYLPEYQVYHIDGSDFSPFDSSQLDTSTKRCFKPRKLQKIFSKEIIKSLSTRAEILELEGDNAVGWNNLIPCIISIGDRDMDYLIKLSLKKCSEMQYLIHTEYPQLKCGVAFFSQLVELHLVEVNMREICYGSSYPNGFLNQLKKLELKKCRELGRTLFKGELDLGNLGSMYIKDCSMTYIFHPSTAQSLTHLETLKIVRCSLLKYIIQDEGSSVEEIADFKDSNPRSRGSIMFQQLKLLRVEECDELELIFPICYCEDLPLLESVKILKCKKLKYMFDQYPIQGGLHQMQNDSTLHLLKVMSIEDVPLFVDLYPEYCLPQQSTANTCEKSKEKDKGSSRNMSRDPLAWFSRSPQKSKTTYKDNATISAISQEKYVGHKAHGFFTPPLYPSNLRKMVMKRISNLKSLFSVSIASSMSLLEELVVSKCDELEYIVMEEVDDGHDHMNATSIFPNLLSIKIKECGMLEYVFPASCSRYLVCLKSIHIRDAGWLKYVFGKSCDDDSNSPHGNLNIEIDLSALNKLILVNVPDMVSICPEKYHVKALSLQDISLDGCPQLPINSFVDLSVVGHKGQEQSSPKKLIGMQLGNLKRLSLGNMDMETIYDLERLEIASPMNSSLEALHLEGIDTLRSICAGSKNLHMSFQNLGKLAIYQCHQLRFLMSTSMSRRLPYLRHLLLSKCEKLECILEDDEEECYFPSLRLIYLDDCERLKCLFSISTCATLPKLSLFYITDAPELEQVFEWKQGATQELDINHVFPNLFGILLEDLPKLHTICPPIDFQSVIYRIIDNCPNLSLNSTHTCELFDRLQDWLENSENNSDMDSDDLLMHAYDRAREIFKKTVKRDPPTAEQNSSSSSNIKKIQEASDEQSIESEEAIKADEVNDS